MIAPGHPLPPPTEPGPATSGADVEREALDVLDGANRARVPLRLIGSLAIALASPASRHLFAALGRRPPQDVDFVAYGRDIPRLAPLFADRGYVLHPLVSHSREWGLKRLIYTHPSSRLKVDVFIDQLVMAHTVDFTGRLDGDSRTVSLADLLLSKLQIFRITDNDLIDLVVLLAEHDLADDDRGIDRHRVARVLGADWGFWFGARRNLDLLGESLDGFAGATPATRAQVRTRVAALRELTDHLPTTTRWRLRARIGVRAPWYEDVEDLEL